MRAFDLQFHESDKLYSLVNIMRMGTLEFLAFCLAIIAGFIVIARVLKSYLGNTEYFQGMDRECNMLFGAREDNNGVNQKF